MIRHRRRYTAVCALLLLLGAAFPAVAQELPADSLFAAPQGGSDSLPQHGAVLRLEATLHDFGDVPRRGGDLSCEIVFTNAGDAPLVVSRLVTSSSCLRASCSRRPVAPGARGTIRILYQPLKSGAGAFSRVIRIGSNAVAGDVQITVCGNSFDSDAPHRRGRHGRNKLKIKRKRQP